MMQMGSLRAISMRSFLKTTISDGKSKIIFPEGTIVRLKDTLAANKIESVTVKTSADNLVLIHNKKNTNPNYSQPALKNLSYTDKAMQSHEPFHERTLVTIQNNNVESLPSIYFTRPTCGYTYTTKAPKRCGIFMTNGTKIENLSN